MEGGVGVGSSNRGSMDSGHGSGMVSISGNGGSMSHSGYSGGGMSDSGGSSVGGNGGSVDSDGGLVDADGVLVNDGGLDDVLDGVNLVGLGDSVGLGNLNGVGLGNMFVDDDLTFNGSGHGDGDLDGVSVYLKLGFDATHLRGDFGVGADGSSDSLDGDGVSGGGSLKKE